MSAVRHDDHPGLQTERTVLAWRRTALAVVIGAVVGARLLAPTLGPGAAVLGIGGVAAGLCLHLSAVRRAGRIAASLRKHDDFGPGAATLVLASAVGVAAGVGALTILLVRALA